MAYEEKTLISVIEEALKENRQVLNLSRKNIDSIPPEIGKLKKLQELYLEGNNISKLPSEISGLTGLRKLYLRANNIEALPSEIGKLTELKKLDLSHNKLETLPAEIGNLVNLEKLDLEWNRIEYLPAEIGKLISLERLDLYGNSLTGLPSQIGNLRKLRKLYLRSNNLAELPPEIGELEKLERLYLYSNKLLSLPREIGNLYNLNGLYLRSNNLTFLPPEIGRLNNLKKLDISHNLLPVLPSEIGDLVNLESLSLRDNRLLELPLETGNLKNLKELDLMGNKLPLPDRLLKRKEMPDLIIKFYLKNNYSDKNNKALNKTNRIKNKEEKPGGRQFPIFINQSNRRIILQDRYEILELIKAGGMGSVYRAYDHRLTSICAVKELLSYYKKDVKQKAEARKRFKREARILANLNHPRLPHVSDYFVFDEKYYLIMDFIEGKDLEEILESEGSPGLPEEKIIRWTVQALEVLHYLHNQSPPIIYRDIKPGNIMIEEMRGVILVDFGLARKLYQKGLTQTMGGTLQYTPLEQLQGKADIRSDIYSLGAAMHHLLTGVEPLPLTDFTSVRKINPQVSSELDRVIMKALKPDPKERFSSAKEMLKALNFALV